MNGFIKFVKAIPLPLWTWIAGLVKGAILCSLAG